MKKWLSLLLVLVLLACCGSTALAADGYDINTAKQSVVRLQVFITVIDERYPEYYGVQTYVTGSGFALGDPNDSSVRYIATAGHVLMHNVESGDVNAETFLWEDAAGNPIWLRVHVDDVRVLLTDVSQFIRANVEGWSERADVAVVRLNDPISVRKAAVLLDKKDFPINTNLTAMGFPAAAMHNLAYEVTEQLLSTTENVSVNKGTFSSWDAHATTRGGDQITTTAEMSGGISGGPLVDDDGYVVGVCVAGSSVRQNMNYAVATDELVRLLGGITEAKYVMGPLQQKGLSTTMWIIIGAAAAVIVLLLVLILLSGSKKKSRTLVFGGVLGNKPVQLKKGSPVVVGRDPNKCQVVYPKDTPGVSTVHCTITYDGNEVTVADNGSSYGTFVGGVKVEPGRPMIMHRGQEVTFGSAKNPAELH